MNKTMIKKLLMFALAMVTGAVLVDVYQWDNGNGFAADIVSRQDRYS